MSAHHRFGVRAAAAFAAGMLAREGLRPGLSGGGIRVPLADLDREDVPVLHSIPQSERPVLSMLVLGQLVHAPTAAILYQLLEVAVRGNPVRVAHYEQPVFAWR